MGTLSEIIKKLKEAKNLEVGEDETKRIRITIKLGQIEVVTEAVPDLDALSLEHLYRLQEEYEARVDAMNEAEPDVEDDPEAYEKWEEQLDLLEQDLEEVSEKIEELEEEEEAGEEEE